MDFVSQHKLSLWEILQYGEMNNVHLIPTQIRIYQKSNNKSKDYFQTDVKYNILYYNVIIQLMMKILLLFMWNIALSYGFTFASLNVNPDSQIINTVTTYQIDFIRSEDDNQLATAYASQLINPGDSITIKFPSVFVLSTVTCIISVNSGSQFAPGCTVQGQKVIVTGYITTSTAIATVSVWVSNVLNPSPAIETAPFVGTIGPDVSGSGVFSSTAVLYPGTFTSCYSTFVPSTVNSTGNMTLTFVPLNQIGAGGYLKITFPNRRWTNDISTTNYMPITTSMSCSSHSANVQSSIGCTGDAALPVVTTNSMFASAVSTSFSFSINNFLSPPTNEQVDRISATSYSADGYQIDTCNFYVSDLTPKAITSITIANSLSGSMVVNTFYTLRFTFVIPDTIAQSDTLTIVFPTGSVVNFVSSSVSANYSSAVSSTSFEPSTLTLYLSVNNQLKTFNKGTVVVVIVGSYQAPPSTQPTSNFILTLYKNGYKKQQGTGTLTATASTVAGSASMTVSTVNANTSYILSITITDALSASGKIKITLPSVLSILTTSPSCASVSGVNVSVAPVCAFNTTQNSITLSSLNASSSNIGAQVLTITISSIKNAASIKTTPSFAVTTYYKTTDASLVAVGTVTGVTASIASMPTSSVTVSASSYTVNDIGVTYSIKHTVTQPIPAGGYFLIYVPLEIVLDITAVPNVCFINVNNTSYMSTPCTAVLTTNAYIINYTNPLLVDATVNTVLVARISGAATNPSSTRPSSSFKLYTYHSNGFAIASIQDAISVQMTTPDNFDQITITRSSNKNYDLCTYYFTLIQPSPYQSSSVVYITFPSNAIASSASTCAMTTPAVSSLSCTYSSQTMRVVLPASAISGGTRVSISVTNVRNPASFQALGSFEFRTNTSNQLYEYSYQIFSPSLTNTIASNFDSISQQFTPAVYGQAVSLKITFNPSDSTKLASTLKLSLANSFTLGTLSCNSFIDFTGVCTSVGSTITVTGTFTNAAMSFSVTGITTPITAPSDYSSMVTFDSNGNKLDEALNAILFSIGCTLPCRTCQSSSQPTVCTSCYSLTTISTYIYYDSTLNQCYEQCPDGKYENTVTHTCSPCDTNCLKCDTSATYCTACASDSIYKYLYLNTSATPNTQTCVSACPLYMYADPSNNNICTACVPPCLACSGASVCTSCVSDKYLSNGACVSTCPTGLAIANTATNVCDPCDTNCATCAVSTTSCTSCIPTLLLYLSQCRTSCPSPLVPQNGTCGPCDPSCQTCSGDKFTCTACDTGSTLPYLHNSKCLATCPQLYYNNIGQGVCSLCSSVSNLNCSNCSSVSTCYTCNTGFVLYNQTCLDYVPSGYVNISGVAQPCAGDCATCAVSTTNCTSCKNYNLLNNLCYQQCPAGFVGMSRVCQPCVSPCSTCSPNTTTCTSCITTFTPDVYLSSGKCVQVCPDATYASDANNSCVACVSPCEYCTSATTCRTCLTGFFLYQGACNNTCPTGYAGVNRICQQCIGNCATCLNQVTYCTSCIANTYLYQLNNSCVASCGNGLFVDATTQTCVYCTPPCKTCVNTSSTCLSCLTGVLLNSVCITSCPTQYFNQVGICQQCPSNCAECTSLTNCTSCLSPYLLYNAYCISQCPPTHAIIANQACNPCTGASCHECTPADVCTMCDSTYSLLNGACLVECPAAYKTNGTHCVDINQQVLTSSNSFPVPFSIAAAVVIVACLMSKLQFTPTFLPGAIFAFLGLLQCGALAFFLYLYHASFFTSSPFPFYIGIAALVYLYTLNLFAVIIHNIVFCYDKQFRTWYGAHGSNKCANFIINIFSLVINHKFRNILFSKLFTFSIFSAQLESISKFKALNIFSFLSLVHSAAAIFASSVAIGSTEKSSQLYYECVDVIVVTSLNAVLAFFNVMKPHDFFVQRTPEGYDLKRKMRGEDDYYQAKIQAPGNQLEDEQGFVSNVYHVQGSNKEGLATAFTSNKPFRGYKKQYDISSLKDESYGSLAQKKYEQISVQAVEIIDDTEFNDPQKFDITAIPQLQQQNSNYTVFFSKTDKGVGNTIEHGSDKGIQNTIDHGPSMKSASIQPSFQQQKPQLNDRSIQPSVNRMVDQSVQQGYSSLEPVDRSVQRTIFFQQDQEVQYAESMKSKPPSLRDQSVSMAKLSVKDKSIQEIRSVSNKSIMYQPSRRNQSNQKSTIEKIDEQIQHQPIFEDEGIMAIEQQSDKGNQKDVSVGQKSVQFTRKSNKDKSIQHQNQIQFDQYTSEIPPSKSNDPILAEDEESKKQISDEKILKEQVKDELLLPKQEIKSYQQQLEERIRQKEKELSQIKRKIQLKQKKNNDNLSKMNKKPKFIDQSKSLIEQQGSSNYKQSISNEEDKTNMATPNTMLRKQKRQVEEQLDAQIDKTIQQIQVIDDEGGKKKAQRQFDDASKRTEEQFQGMLEEHPTKIIFENQVDEDQDQNRNESDLIEEFVLQDRQSKNKVIMNRQANPQYYQSSAQISSGKEGSTKIYSSKVPINPIKRGSFHSSHVEVIENASQEYMDPIDERPVYPYQPHPRSDMSHTIEQLQPNLNHTEDSSQINKINNEQITNKIKQSLSFNKNRSKKEIPSDKNQIDVNRRRLENTTYTNSVPKLDNDHRKFKAQNQVKEDRRKSSLLLIGKSQFAEQRLAKKPVGRASPLKTVKRWSYENQDRTLQEDAQEEVQNKRGLNSHLIAPLQTDKQIMDFKTSRVRGSDYLNKPKQPKIIQKKNSEKLTDQISPFIGQVSVSETPHKPKIIQTRQLMQQFGTDQHSGQPYIEEYSEDMESKYRNSFIIGQMLDRPGNRRLEEYYGNKNRKSKEKQKLRKNATFNEYQSETQKIYNQKLLDGSKKR